MQNKGKLTIMKYFRACVGSFLVLTKFGHCAMHLHKPRVLSPLHSLRSLLKHTEQTCDDPPSQARGVSPKTSHYRLNTLQS